MECLETEPLGPFENICESFIKKFTPFWINDYKKTARGRKEIVKFTFGGFTFLFDHTGDPSADARVVGVYGITGQGAERRDTSRMKGFIGGFKNINEYKFYDKGHYIAHLAGGPLDINLYPQLTELNRGWSEEGKLFRSMEKFCSQNTGTFVFTRPFYKDSSWIPERIEYGYLSKELVLKVHIFNNFK